MYEFRNENIFYSFAKYKKSFARKTMCETVIQLYEEEQLRFETSQYDEMSSLHESTLGWFTVSVFTR